MIYLTADTHFNHRNICRGISQWEGSENQTRDFATLDEMNAHILDCINNTVKEDDILYHLGDFAFGDKKLIPDWRYKIRCKTVHLIYGNHDTAIENSLAYQKCFTTCSYYKEIVAYKTRICLFHYAMHVWNKHADKRHPAIQLHGHSHGSLPVSNRKREDIGYDCYNKPLNIPQIFDIMKDRVVEPVDHHSPKTNYGKPDK